MKFIEIRKLKNEPNGQNELNEHSELNNLNEHMKINKGILKIITLVLIQMFWVMDFAFYSAGEAVECNWQINKTTLAPKITVATESIQSVFSRYLKESTFKSSKKNISKNLSKGANEIVVLNDEEVRFYLGDALAEKAKIEGLSFFIQELSAEQVDKFRIEWSVFYEECFTEWKKTHDSKYILPIFGLAEKNYGLISLKDGKETLQGYLGLRFEDVNKIYMTQIELCPLNIGKKGRIKGITDLLFDWVIKEACETLGKCLINISCFPLSPGSNRFNKRQKMYVLGGGREGLWRKDILIRYKERALADRFNDSFPKTELLQKKDHRPPKRNIRKKKGQDKIIKEYKNKVIGGIKILKEKRLLTEDNIGLFIDIIAVKLGIGGRAKKLVGKIIGEAFAGDIKQESINSYIRELYGLYDYKIVDNFVNLVNDNKKIGELLALTFSSSLRKITSNSIERSKYVFLPVSKVESLADLGNKAARYYMKRAEILDVNTYIKTELDTEEKKGLFNEMLKVIENKKEDFKKTNFNEIIDELFGIIDLRLDTDEGYCGVVSAALVKGFESLGHEASLYKIDYMSGIRKHSFFKVRNKEGIEWVGDFRVEQLMDDSDAGFTTSVSTLLSASAEGLADFKAKISYLCSLLEKNRAKSSPKMPNGKISIKQLLIDQAI